MPGWLVPGGALSAEGQSGVLEWAKHPGLGLGLTGDGQTPILGRRKERAGQRTERSSPHPHQATLKLVS